MDQSNTPTKICTKCHEEKPITAYYFDPRRNKHAAACQSCENARKKAYIAQDRQAHRERCKKWQSTHQEQTREIATAWRNNNIEKERERNRIDRAANPEKHREKVRRSYEKHKVERRTSAGEHYQKNRTEILARHAARNATMRASDPIAYLLAQREARGRRRAVLNSAPYETVDYRAILERDGYHCRLCGNAIEPRSINAIEFDHFIPIEKGGAHRADNIVVAHKSCNKRKWNKFIEQLS